MLKGGCLKKVGIGCLTLVILLVLGGVLVHRMAKSAVTRLAALYTDTAPTDLPKFQMADGENVRCLSGWMRLPRR